MNLDNLWPAWEPARLLHDDDDLLVVDKPPGVPTHPPEPHRIDDAHSRLLAWLREQGEPRPYLGIHQRLDRETSGVLLFARRREANRWLAEQFEKRLVGKTYLAAAEGLGARRQGTLVHRLVPGEDGAMRALPAGTGRGQEARARWRVAERHGERALLEVTPETGRTHQVRVQLAAAGLPIAGDRLYGGPPATRLLLHAARLEIRRPSGEISAFAAPLPEPFRRWLEGKPPVDPADPAAVERALREAAAARYGLARGEDTTAFRLLNGAGDGLPGVAVDRYGGFLVVSLSGAEAEAAREGLLDAAERLGADGVYLKIRPRQANVIVDSRRPEYAPERAVRGRDAPDPLEVTEQGVRLRVRLGDGLSTGLFLDQRENRARLRSDCRGLRVLNLFAYTGAFTAAAVAGGASETVSVDASAGVLERARENLEALGADPAKHRLEREDAAVWLRGAVRRGERFDRVILDPPSYSTTKASRFSAETDYRDLAALVFGVMAPEGRLLACTNHRGIPRLKFRRFLHEAARAAGRELRQLKDLPPPDDFPAAPGEEPSLKVALATLAPAPKNCVSSASRDMLPGANFRRGVQTDGNRGCRPHRRRA